MSKLSNDNIVELLNGISDRQAIDSEFEGYSDGEDAPCFDRYSISRTYKRKVRNTNLHGQSSCSTPSPLHSVTSSKLRPQRQKCSANSEMSSQDSDWEYDDSDVDPTYEPILNKDELGNSLTENNNEVLNDILNISEPNNTENIDLLVDFIENYDSEDSVVFENNNFQFSKEPPFTELTYNTFTFNEPYGPNVFVDTKSPLQNFEIFFSDFYQHIVDQSNIYSNQCGKNLNLNIAELKAFLGILIIMDFNKLPSIRLYWSADENCYNPRIANIMTQKRFLNILRYLHLNNNSVMPQKGSASYDKLYKIRPMINYLNDAFRKSFSPDKHLSCDESMVAFKGRSGIKQYMPMKPVKRGFKIWALCCSGYLLSFMVYEGKKESKEQGSLGEKTVLEMTSNYQEKGYCVFFDRFFSSIDLVLKLLSRKIFACGTMMQNRKYFPKSILKSDKTLKMDEYDFATSGEISVFKWMDRGKKPVVTVSTIHKGETTSIVKRKNNLGVREDVQCPLRIAEYNKYMGGVDHFDQLKECYNIAWKSRRWWVKLFYHFCDATIVNAYIMYTTSVKLNSNKIRPLNQLLFRSTLANELIGEFCSRKTVAPNKNIPSTKRKPNKTGDGRIILPGNNSRLQNVGNHLPIVGKYNRCRLCSTKKNVKRSKITCKECKVALCLECFLPFHSP